MALQWSQNLSTGLEWQDKEHMELFNRINKLLEEMSKGRGKEEILNTLRFLDTYVVKHFGKEEQEMGKYNYPEAITHKGQHALFVKNITRLRADLEKGATLNLVVQAQIALGDWLKNHIGSVDKKLASFLVNI